MNQLVKDGERDDALYCLLRDFFSSLQDIQTGKAHLIGIAALAKLGCILGCQPYAKGIMQRLMRSQSLLAFNRRCTKTEYADLARRTSEFLYNTCTKPLRSKEFFDFYASSNL